MIMAAHQARQHVAECSFQFRFGIRADGERFSELFTEPLNRVRQPSRCGASGGRGTRA